LVIFRYQKIEVYRADKGLARISKIE